MSEEDATREARLRGPRSWTVPLSENGQPPWEWSAAELHGWLFSIPTGEVVYLLVMTVQDALDVGEDRGSLRPHHPTCWPLEGARRALRRGTWRLKSRSTAAWLYPDVRSWREIEMPRCLTCKAPVDRVEHARDVFRNEDLFIYYCHGQRETLSVPGKRDKAGNLDELRGVLSVAFEPPELLAAGW